MRDKRLKYHVFLSLPGTGRLAAKRSGGVASLEPK
jgi:hypothetical protein